MKSIISAPAPLKYVCVCVYVSILFLCVWKFVWSFYTIMFDG